MLASGSPRRRAILSQLCIPHVCAVPDVDEQIIDGESPSCTAIRLAELKCRAITGKMRETWQGYVLAADTVVAVDGDALGCPQDAVQARHYLQRLSGRDHLVITGIALALPRAETQKSRTVITSAEMTRVYFRKLKFDEIDAYVDSGEPVDKAGAYAIQGAGARFVRKIEGCFYNVVGLPVAALLDLLEEGGYLADRVV